MLPRLGPLPTGERWSFEPKWDGFRALAFVDGRARLVSRRGNDLTHLCPQVASLTSAGLGDAVLDGEIVALRDGRPSFEALQARMREGSSEAVALLAFDVLWLRGESLVDHPYEARRDLLEGLELPDPAYVSPRFDDGEALFHRTREQGFEGVVAKRRSSLYRSGERTSAWTKAKHWQEDEFGIGGWSPPRGDHGWGSWSGSSSTMVDWRSGRGWSSGSAPPTETNSSNG